jgi:hypothetical protein
MGQGNLNGGLGVLPLTALEVRRVLVALVWAIPVTPGFVLAGPVGIGASGPLPTVLDKSKLAQYSKAKWSYTWILQAFFH